ncbi:MAG TPA: ABC transporter ATP-binding protein [Dehalococcoidia bacterium]|nr:ABC transporter ATP-binding protein [Dehalococcoidia bacterium]
MLKIQEVDVFYGPLQALWGVSMEVKEGEVVALVGSNGAGKTTTLKTVMGVLKSTSGQVVLNGVDVSRAPAFQMVDMGITLVPEGRGIFPEMTVQENLDLGAYPRRARAGMSDSLQWVYRLFPIIKERRNQAAGTLSGGEQQMLAIGRALMSRPSLLMLDEPSLGLSPLLTIEIFKLVEDIRREGVTVLLVEQNVYQALKVSDRAYVLETGRVTMYGQSGQLLADEGLRRSYLGL